MSTSFNKSEILSSTSDMRYFLGSFLIGLVALKNHFNIIIENSVKSHEFMFFVLLPFGLKQQSLGQVSGLRYFLQMIHFFPSSVWHAWHFSHFCLFIPLTMKSLLILSCTFFKISCRNLKKNVVKNTSEPCKTLLTYLHKLEKLNK